MSSPNEVHFAQSSFELITKQLSPATERSGALAGNWTTSMLEEEARVCENFSLFKPEHELVGTILFRRTTDLIEVSLVAIEINHQGQNYGSTLFAEFVKQYESYEIWLEVHEDNLSAQKIYLNNGFKQVGERKNYYSDGAKCLLYNYFRS